MPSFWIPRQYLYFGIKILALRAASKCLYLGFKMSEFHLALKYLHSAQRKHLHFGTKHLYFGFWQLNTNFGCSAELYAGVFITPFDSL
jgi:hypothetical protein